MFKLFKNILFIILIVFVIYYIVSTIIINIHKEQICILTNPTGEITKGYINTLNYIAPQHNTTWFDKSIIQPGIKLEIWRNSLSINWLFWLHC